MIVRVPANDPTLATPTPACAGRWRQPSWPRRRRVADSDNARCYPAFDAPRGRRHSRRLPVVDDAPAARWSPESPRLPRVVAAQRQRLVLTVCRLMNASPLVADEARRFDLCESPRRRSRSPSHRRVCHDPGWRYLGVGTAPSVMRRLAERREAVLFQMTHHDSLTGLPNRQLFDDRLSQAVARGRRSGRPVACSASTSIGSRTSTSRLGHAIGDRLLGASPTGWRGWSGSRTPSRASAATSSPSCSSRCRMRPARKSSRERSSTSADGRIPSTATN